MTEPSNAVLSEQVRQLRKDFYYHKEATKSDVKQLEDEVNRTKEATHTLNLNMSYVRETVSETKDMTKNMMNEFVKVQNEQSNLINDFINSDNRMSNKRKFWVSVLQVVSGIVLTVITIWLTGEVKGG